MNKDRRWALRVQLTRTSRPGLGQLAQALWTRSKCQPLNIPLEDSRTDTGFPGLQTAHDPNWFNLLANHQLTANANATTHESDLLNLLAYPLISTLNIPRADTGFSRNRLASNSLSFLYTRTLLRPSATRSTYPHLRTILGPPHHRPPYSATHIRTTPPSFRHQLR